MELVTEVAPSPMPASEALELVGLGKRLHHFPAQLSGGEQQRVAIARAIAKRPTVLLCDEPTGALDVATGVHVLEAIVTANNKLGTTTLLITHNADIARIGDRVVRFADGHIRSIEANEKRIAADGVELVMRLATLDRKLLRDLKRLKRAGDCRLRSARVRRGAVRHGHGHVRLARACARQLLRLGAHGGCRGLGRARSRSASRTTWLSCRA